MEFGSMANQKEGEIVHQHKNPLVVDDVVVR